MRALFSIGDNVYLCLNTTATDTFASECAGGSRVGVIAGDQILEHYAVTYSTPVCIAVLCCAIVAFHAIAYASMRLKFVSLLRKAKGISAH